MTGACPRARLFEHRELTLRDVESTMARLLFVDPGDPDLPPDVREIVDRFGGADSFAGPPNILRAVANHPGAARIVAEAGAVLYGSGTLTPAQRELAYLTASVVNSCHY
jgi:alkylhydroperoxidase family enzyme